MLRPIRRGCVVSIIVGVCLISVVRGGDDGYSAGPVVVLHNWLGDQCSFVPDLNVGECCLKHDEAYQKGGTESDRYWADVEFRDCIVAHERPIVAVIYFWGVRVFGWLFFNYN